MKFPSINKQAKRRVNIPSFTGGINLRDRISMCGDNQLTELVNMWYKDGSLKTRPGLKFSAQSTAEIGRPTKTLSADTKLFSNIQYETTEEGETYNYILEVTRFVREAAQLTSNETYDIYFCFRWVCAKKATELSFIVLWNQDASNMSGKGIGYFVVEKDGILYCFLSNQTIYKLEYMKNGTQAEWEPVNEEDCYAPLVMIDGTAMNGNIDNLGIQYEGYNLIGSHYRMRFSAKDKSQTENEMCYRILFDAKEGIEEGGTCPFNEMKIKAKLNGVEHIATYNHLGSAFEKFEENYVSEDGYYLVASGSVVWFTEEKDAGLDEEKIAKIPSDWYTTDDLEITAPCGSSYMNRAKIFNMTQAEWFGGSSAGLTGGTRLFLCGNADENEKARVCWSGLNNPLYFPENSYFYVGNTSERVTGFGKQSNMLVIFKDNETWYTQYAQNSNISAESLINQSTVDIQASAVYFPLIQINSSIGCAYPETVQLCRNRLVFMGSDKKVYTLVSENQYNERSIFCVSEMVDSALKSETVISGSCDWNGYYCLHTSNRLYILDYNSYGYQYISSYSKTEDSNLRIPWYIWELPSSIVDSNCTVGSSISTVGSSIIISGYFDAEAHVNCSIVSYCINEENTEYDSLVFENGNKLDFKKQKIKSLMQTKIFDFNEPNAYKNICSVGLSFGCNGGNEITVTFVTDGGDEQTSVILEDEAKKRTAGFTKSVILRPAIHSAVRFGVRFECEGNMIIDGMTMDYRVLGGAR